MSCKLLVIICHVLHKLFTMLTLDTTYTQHITIIKISLEFSGKFCLKIGLVDRGDFYFEILLVL